LSNKISLVPELLLTSVLDKNNTSSELHHFILLPVLGKYKITDKLGILFGPQLNYTISKPNESVKKLNVALNAGLHFNVTNKLSLQTNYAIGVNNTVNIDNYTAKYDHLTFNLGYNFL